MEDMGNYGYTLFRTIPVQALPQRISFARIGQEKEKVMVGGKVMSGKGKRNGCNAIPKGCALHPFRLKQSRC